MVARGNPFKNDRKLEKRVKNSGTGEIPLKMIGN